MLVTPLRATTGTLLLLACVCTLDARADDAARPAWTTSRLKGSPYPPSPYAIRPAFPQLAFVKPTSLEELPGGRMLVSEIGGAIYTFPKRNRETATKDLLLKIEGSPSIWHATAHPKFASNGRLFVCYSRDGETRVSRYSVAGDPPRADASGEEVLLTWPAGGHNGGCLQFGVDGMLYISTGDGSGPNPPDGRTAAQDVGNLFGCLLRIDVNRQSGGKNYAIPPDNPFVDLAGARPEIWAYGLRNPWKFGVDRSTGAIFAADNGWESWEMIHRIVRGGNCGWPIMEGRAVLRSEVARGPTPIRPPVKDHPHSEANSVIGGPIYRGSKLEDLDGAFIYGDYITGTIWSLRAEGDGEFAHRTLVDTDQRITAFAEGSGGELFVLDFDYTGRIYELVPSGQIDRSAEFPRRLSETGLFTSLENMRPAAGVIPYDVNVRQWMDGERTHRWVAIPGNGSITLGDGDRPAEYPDGTVFVKHLTHNWEWRDRRIPLETQILHYENGTWRPYTYVWNNALTDAPRDATLVDAAGATLDVPIAHREGGGYIRTEKHFGAQNECRLCHNAGTGVVLGFVANQLDKWAARPGDFVPQLSTLAKEKTIARVPETPENNPARLVDPHDKKQSLDDRARSYLHGNCSSCHHPGGNAIVSFYLRRDMPFAQLNTNKGTGIGTFGLRDAKIITPGDPYRSILLYRMTKLGYGRMPYIGSQVVDSRGVALIEEWIRAMPNKDIERSSTLVRSGSRDAKALDELKRKQRGSEYFRIDREPTSFLFESTEGALAVALAIHGEAAHRVSRDAYHKTRPDISGLFEDFVPRELRRKTFGRYGDPKSVLSLTGDAERGRLIFFSDSARCSSCHNADDAAKSTGPTLVEIRKKYKNRAELLKHILEPSLKVDDKYAAYVVVTKDGRIHQGLVESNSDDLIVLKTAERKTIRIPKDSVEEQRRSPRSLMPEGALSDLTVQEAADLLHWFGSF